MVALKQAKQLTLPVQLPDAAQFSMFITGENKALLEYLQTPFSPESFIQTSIYGSSGTGKTHLLWALTEQAQQDGLVSMYVPMQEALAEGHPALLEGLENCHVLALDDVHLVTEHSDWNLALFALINRFIDRRSGHLVWSAAQSAHQFPVALADLRSRLQAATSFPIKPLSDADKTLALQTHAQHRGLVLAEDVVDYLLNRLPRDMHVLMRVLEQLDSASMREQRRLTLPFVKQVLSL